jgi:uncharacterized protein (TIGR03435 family)
MNRNQTLRIILATTIAVSFCEAQSQEFEAASVKSAPPRSGFPFSFSTEAGSGGPGTADPGMFRCGSCTLAALISKAFQLRDYQFPGKASLPGGGFEIAAKIPPNATQEQFSLMLQNLLKERFGLAYHLEEKTLRGYHLTVAKNGPKLKEATGAPVATAERWGQGESHSHSGAMNFNGQARYQGSGRTMADLVQVLSDQLGFPVDDQTGLPGKYDIALSWTSDSTGNVPPHGDGGDHAGHGGPPSAGGDTSGLGLSEALQSQLGLKLVQGNKSAAKIFVVDHIEKLPISN